MQQPHYQSYPVSGLNHAAAVPRPVLRRVKGSNALHVGISIPHEMAGSSPQSVSKSEPVQMNQRPLQEQVVEVTQQVITTSDPRQICASPVEECQFPSYKLEDVESKETQESYQSLPPNLPSLPSVLSIPTTTPSPSPSSFGQRTPSDDHQALDLGGLAVPIIPPARPRGLDVVRSVSLPDVWNRKRVKRTCIFRFRGEPVRRNRLSKRMPEDLLKEEEVERALIPVSAVCEALQRRVDGLEQSIVELRAEFQEEKKRKVGEDRKGGCYRDCWIEEGKEVEVLRAELMEQRGAQMQLQGSSVSAELDQGPGSQKSSITEQVSSTLGLEHGVHNEHTRGPSRHNQECGPSSSIIHAQELPASFHEVPGRQGSTHPRESVGTAEFIHELPAMRSYELLVRPIKEHEETAESEQVIPTHEIESEIPYQLPDVDCAFLGLPELFAWSDVDGQDAKHCAAELEAGPSFPGADKFKEKAWETTMSAPCAQIHLIV
ncbi:hypothetical protein F5882DRAFT_519731 [Hyaloscypha sp. PMI_1271]|nr:hypothetical protein F5882DRAFT_519731 [Hyaloscypha sp. PMI_1271]